MSNLKFFKMLNFKINKSHRILLFGININSITRFAFQTILAIYLNSQGLSPSNIGIISLCYFVTMRFVGPFLGLLIDLFGTKNIFCSGYLMTSIGFIFCRSSEINIFFFLGITLLGLGFGFINIAGEVTLIQMSNTKDQENRVIALNYIFLNFAASIGPLVSGIILIINSDPIIFFLLYSITNLFTGLCFYIFFPFNVHKKQKGTKLTNFTTLKIMWENKKFIKYIFSLPPIWFIFSLVHTTVPVFILETTNIDKTIIASMFSLAAIIVLLFGYPVNRYLIVYCKKRNRSYMDGLVIGSLLMGLGIFSLWTSILIGFMSVYIFIILFTFGELCFVPMVSLLVNELKPDDENSIGISFGIASLACGIGQGLSNLMGGYFIEFCQKNGFFLFPLLLGTFALSVSLFYLSYSNKFRSS